MDDNFNTALGLAALFDMGREINSFINDKDFAPTPAVIHSLVQVRKTFRLLDTLGLLPGEKRQLGAEFGERLQEIALSLKGVAGDLLPGQLPQTAEEILDILITVRRRPGCGRIFNWLISCATP